MGPTTRNPSDAHEEHAPLLPTPSNDPSRRLYSPLVKTLATLAVFGLVGLVIASTTAQARDRTSCDDPVDGYVCAPDISRLWGQYSPYFRIPSRVPDAVPDGCAVDRAILLSRHGARDPTASRSARYAATVDKIQRGVRAEDLVGKYAFLKTYRYSLGADQLNPFGEGQMVHLGRGFAQQYAHLVSDDGVFVRAASQKRVVDSAVKFAEGFVEQSGRKGEKIPITVIQEGPEFNNTLDHSRCAAFEQSHIAGAAKGEWAALFTPAILARLAVDLPGAALDGIDVVNLLSLCPFETVADDRGRPSPFCSLFTPHEFRAYNHYENLDKYYGYGPGDPLGPTQGVGWTNELIARLLEQPVRDATSTNATLDSDPATFPLRRKLYADFSHDNDLTSAMFALGLWADVPPLSNRTADSLETLRGWGASRTVPFGGRLVVERMRCTKGSEGDQGAAEGGARRHDEWVRVVVNGQVVPVSHCGGTQDRWGRCLLRDFVQGLEFARHGGHWDQCFV